MSEQAYQNTDHELWREEDSYYAPSIHVTLQQGIGINVGGHVFVKPVREWHKLASDYAALQQRLQEAEAKLNSPTP